MILTLVLIGTAVLGAGGGTVGYRKLFKYKEAKSYKRSFSVRSVLPDPAWKQLKQHIVDECKGYLYADAMIKEVLNQGYRYSCSHIYELRDLYKSRWPANNNEDYVNALTKYNLTLKAEAEDRIFNLLHGEQLLLDN